MLIRVEVFVPFHSDGIELLIGGELTHLTVVHVLFFELTVELKRYWLFFIKLILYVGTFIIG